MRSFADSSFTLVRRAATNSKELLIRARLTVELEISPMPNYSYGLKFIIMD